MLPPGARERIVQWAEGWRQIGWPIETSPAYLLDSYPDMLAAHDYNRFRGVVQDLAGLSYSLAAAAKG